MIAYFVFVLVEPLDIPPLLRKILSPALVVGVMLFLRWKFKLNFEKMDC